MTTVAVIQTGDKSQSDHVRAGPVNAFGDQPGLFSIAGEGLCVGRDSGEPVTSDYPGDHPHTFTGGTIKRVAVDVSGEPYVDLEREAQAMLARE